MDNIISDKTLTKMKVFLAAVNVKSTDMVHTEESLNELAALAKTLSCEVAGRFIQSRNAPDPKTYMGKGKLEEIRQQIEENSVELILFDHDLSPKQSSNLEDMFNCMVWDRTQVILEIFAQHARTSESRVQVELASLEYMLPRLVGMWAHLDRERGGIGATKGMGEKQVNVDRTIVRNRISKLKKRLKKIASERKTQNKRRSSYFNIVLVGYTNAGKSTLMNLLTGTSLRVENRLFSTLESTTRLLKGVTKPEILLSDTVGFIGKLPHDLIASFHSTLDVVKDADMLIHIVDISYPAVEKHIETTIEVLDGIGAGDVPRLLVFNKIDLFPDEIGCLILQSKYPQSVVISSYDPGSKDRMSCSIKECFQDQFFSQTIRLPYSKCDCLADLYEHCLVGNIVYKENAMYIDCTISHLNKRHLSALL